MTRIGRKSGVAAGYTLMELVVAMFLTIVVLGAVFGLLQKSQRSFARETRVAQANHSLNAALDMIGRDLTTAGYKTPPSAAVWARDGGASDQLTAVYADNEIPTIVRPLRCTDDQNGNPCHDLAFLTSLLVDSDNLRAAMRGLDKAYNRGSLLLAVERTDCNDDGVVGLLPLDLTREPTLDETGNYIEIGYRVGDPEELNLPYGYNDRVFPDCAEIGDFRVIQYRVAMDDKAVPTLERRDYSQLEPWTPVASDVGNLDVQFFSPEVPNDAPQQRTIGGSGGGGRSAGSVKVTLRGGSYVGAGGNTSSTKGTALETGSTDPHSQSSSPSSAPSNSFTGQQSGGSSSTTSPSSSTTTSSQDTASGSDETTGSSGSEPTPTESSSIGTTTLGGSETEETPEPQPTVTTTVTLRNTETYYNTTVPLSGSQNRARLPQIPDISCGESNGNILRVSAGGNFQDALNRASPGDTILLEAGATFMGSFKLPKKNGEACITIRSSALDSQLPPSDTRVTPAYGRFLPKIVSPGSNQSALTTERGAHHYKFLAVEFRPAPGEYIGDLVELGGNAANESELPHHLEFDRVYIHGDRRVGGKRGIALNSGSTTIKNSYISDFKSTGQDTQAICGWAGSGPFRIVNNYLEASGENIMFGGATPGIEWLVPSDIEIRGNHFKKPLSWKEDHATYAGTEWSVKNLFELKNARRVLLEGNVFENNWNQSQTGFAIVLKSASRGGAPWTITEDVTIVNNIIRGANHGITICSRCTEEGIPGKRFTIRNNLFDEIGTGEWGRDGGRLIQILNGVDDVTIEHNTFANEASSGGHAVIADGQPSEGFVYQDNIVPHNRYGVFGSGKGVGITALNAYFPDALFRRNALVNTPSPSKYPPDNFFPDSFHAVGFVDYATENYRLSSSSPYKNAGSDGNDIGANIDELEAATRGAIVGVR